MLPDFFGNCNTLLTHCSTHDQEMCSHQQSSTVINRGPHLLGDLIVVMKCRVRMWSGITPRFAPRSWDARLGASRAVQLAKQASCNDAVRPNPPVQIGEVISDHILTLKQRRHTLHSKPLDRHQRTIASSLGWNAPAALEPSPCDRAGRHIPCEATPRPVHAAHHKSSS